MLPHKMIETIVLWYIVKTVFCLSNINILPPAIDVSLCSRLIFSVLEANIETSILEYEQV